MNSIKQKIAYFSLSAFTLAILIFIQIPSIAELGDLLWAEDGNVFINDVYGYSYESLLKAYAGYIHLYPRIWSLTLLVSGVSSAPFIYLLGWLVAVIFTGYILIAAMQSLGFRFYEALILATLIFLQPSAGEVYFTLTNAQWFLGFGLAIWFLMREQKCNAAIEIFIIMLLSLTGPFSVLLLPVLALKYFLFFVERPLPKQLLIIYLSCVLVQVFSFLVTNREVLPINTDLINWIKSIYIFFTFGLPKFLSILGVIFWSLLVFLLIKNKKNRSKETKVAFLLLIYGFIVWGASLYASKHAPHILSPIGGGNRYFWIPYATVFTAIILITKNSFERFLVYGLILLICVLSISSPKVGRSLTDFRAHLELNKIVKNNIKINPFWQIWPDTWRINSDYINLHGTSFERYEINPKIFISINGKLKSNDWGFSLQELSGDPYFTFKVPSKCNDYDYLSLSVNMDKNSDGNSQLFWAKNFSDMSERNSRSRYVGKGNHNITFAIKKIPGTHYLRFDPSNSGDLISINKIELYCF